MPSPPIIADGVSIAGKSSMELANPVLTGGIKRNEYRFRIVDFTMSIGAWLISIGVALIVVSIGLIWMLFRK